ncbi:MAG: glycosyltransferase [Clostridium sp.]|nr:glycosyltransferase [Clostridium sp.]
MEKYKISIIVPVYNAEQYLERCVDTLLRQNYENLEILLIDDGSRDGSGRLCDELAEKNKKLRVVHKENGGLVSAWKRGVGESSGEYISFVDSDDWVDLCMIEEMAVYLSGNPKEIIASNYIIERERGGQQVRQELPAGEYDREAIKKQVIPNLLGREHRCVAVSRCMKLISRGLLEDNMKYSDEKALIGEDMTIMVPSLIDCHRLVAVDKAYYHYRYVTESMVHKYDKDLYKNIQFLMGILFQIVDDKFEGEERQKMRGQVEREYVLTLFLALKNEARGNPKGYRENIFALCKAREVRELVKRAPVKVKDSSNKLLYLTLKSPNEITVRLLRLAMILYYKKPRTAAK